MLSSQQMALDSVTEGRKTITNLDNDQSEGAIISNVHELDRTIAQAHIQSTPSIQIDPLVIHNKSNFGPSAREISRELLSRMETTSCMPAVPLLPEPHHHLNFWGGFEPIKNDTDPAVSLAILMSPMKGFMPMHGFEHEPRKHVMAWTAHRLIDPVIYIGDFDTLREKTISERRDYAVGEVFKLYTQSGSWQSERPDEDDSKPMVDWEISDSYPGNCTVVNGYMGDKGQPTHDSMTEDMGRAARADARRRKAFTQKRRSAGYGNRFGPSPLSRVYTPESMLAEQREDEARMLAEWQAKRALRAHLDRLMPHSFERSWADLDSDSDSDFSDD